ncbi:MAG TPA: PQQ-binding-like beta-propeller repeat protein [Streptosporangiaceae bacterium]
MKARRRPAVLLALVMAGLASVTLPGTATASATSREWAALYQGSNGPSAATAIAASPDGSSVFVTGSNGNTDGKADFETIRYDAATGGRMWQAPYAGSAGNTFADSVAVSPDGSTVFVTGISANTADTVSAYATLAYSAATGARLWTALYQGPGMRNTAIALAVSPDGSTVFVTGTSATGHTDAYATVAYDAATGAARWTARYHPGPGGSLATAVAVSPDGTQVFVTGYSFQTAGPSDYATVDYDAATGAQQWARRYHGSGNGGSAGTSVAVSPDGGTVYVTGYAGAGNQFLDQYATVAYRAATGRQVWLASYSPVRNSEPTLGEHVAVSPDGTTVFVTGTTAGPKAKGIGYGTVAYDAATGARRWARLYRGPAGASFATAIAASPSGNRVYVTGYSKKQGRLGYGTVAYAAATGAAVWTARFGTPTFSSQAAAIAVSPDGTQVFVTGKSVRAAGSYYGTAAYRG